jgi:hypothetical protein
LQTQFSKPEERNSEAENLNAAELLRIEEDITKSLFFPSFQNRSRIKKFKKASLCLAFFYF